MRGYLLELGFTTRAIAALQHGITTYARELCAFYFLGSAPRGGGTIIRQVQSIHQPASGALARA